MFSTRLYQNTARVHFDAYAGKNTRFGRRLAYGGHVISLARALSFNGLANGFRVAAINGGSHVGADLRRRHDLCLVGSAGKGRRCRNAPISARCVCAPLRPRTARAAISPGKGADGKYHPAVVLDLDYWLLMPRR